MSRRRHTPEQIITALREAEVGLANGKTVGMVLLRAFGALPGGDNRLRLRFPDRQHNAASRGFVSQYNY
jgi:hypothetical protein